MRKGLTEIVFILDRSGSMGGLENDTIGGYIVGAFDHFPGVGETYVSEDGTIIRVLAVEKKRITKLRIKLPAPTNSQPQ